MGTHPPLVAFAEIGKGYGNLHMIGPIVSLHGAQGTLEGLLHLGGIAEISDSIGQIGTSYGNLLMIGPIVSLLDAQGPF